MARHEGWCGLVAAGVTLALLAVAGLQAQAEETFVKRRHQGILTGMPFMANLAPRTFVDDLGRKVFLAKAPTRVVSLAPSITEILYAIGSGEQLVGVTPYCDYPPEVKLKPRVGYANPNLESLLALQPDMVLAPSEFLRADLLDKLEQLKVPLFVLNAKTIEDIPSHIQTLGRMMERSATADALATEMRRRIAEVRSLTQHLVRPRVLYVLNSEPLITVGPGSFLHHLIDLAGGANVAARARTPYPRFSMEEVLKEDPELLVFPVGTAEGISDSEQQVWRRWPTISAVKRGQLHQIPSDLLNRPGPRIVQGLEALTRVIHPGVLGEKPRP